MHRSSNYSVEMYILFVVSVFEQLWLGVDFSTLPNYNHKTIKEVKKHILMLSHVIWHDTF